MASRDFQKQRVYDWESTIACSNPDVLTKPLTFEEVVELVDTVWEHWRPGSHPPIVKNLGKRQIAARGSRREVRFPRWTWFPRIVLHEIAHSLNDKCQSFGYRKKDLCSPHGPEFVRIYCDLIEWYAGRNVVQSAYSAKVKVAPKLEWAKPQKKRSQKLIEHMRQVWGLVEGKRVSAEMASKSQESFAKKYSGPSRFVRDESSPTGVRRIVLTKNGLPDKRYREN